MLHNRNLWNKDTTSHLCCRQSMTDSAISYIFLEVFDPRGLVLKKDSHKSNEELQGYIQFVDMVSSSFSKLRW